MSVNRKVFQLSLSVFVCIGLGFIYFSTQQVNQSLAKKNTPLSVSVISARHHTIFDEIEALGTAYANEAVYITSSVTEKIQEIRFSDGQTVKANDILVTLEQNEELAQKKAAESLILENERELNRLDDLIKKKAAAETQYDARKTLLTISQHKLAEIEARIADRTIRAPFDGKLGLRKISPGSLVSPGTIITTLDDVSKIKLDFSIPASFLDVVQEGSVIEARSSSLAKNVVQGTVTNINSRVDPKTRSVEIRAMLPNPTQTIKPGILMSVTLLRNKREALLIPEEAIIQLQSDNFIFTVNKNNIIERKKIKIGVRHPGWVEVINGIIEGEQVVIRGSTRISAGDTVTLVQVNFSPDSGN
jgi:membrane fusion protein, multidrug efflux system